MSIIEPFRINTKFTLTHFGIQLVAIWQVEVNVTDWFHFQMLDVSAITHKLTCNHSHLRGQP